METYKHTVQYYETDRMGITHHSNYIRWMEEARGYFLEQLGWNYTRLEEMGIISPVIDIACKYKNSTTYADEVFIELYIKEYNGIKLSVHYEMTNAQGKVVAECDSTHCFLSKEGKPVRIAKLVPEFHEALLNAVETK